jgi:hypothetical protein
MIEALTDRARGLLNKCNQNITLVSNLVHSCFCVKRTECLSIPACVNILRQSRGYPHISALFIFIFSSLQSLGC